MIVTEKHALLKTERNCKILASLLSVMLIFTAVEMKSHSLRDSLLLTFDSLSKRLSGNNVPAFILKAQQMRENFATERTVVANSYLNTLKNGKSTYNLTCDWNKKTHYFHSDWKKNGEVFFAPSKNNAPLSKNQKLAMVCDEIHNLMMQTPENKQTAMLLGYLKQKDMPILNYYMNYSGMRKHSEAFIQIGEQELKKMHILKMQKQRF